MQKMFLSWNMKSFQLTSLTVQSGWVLCDTTTHIIIIITTIPQCPRRPMSVGLLLLRETIINHTKRLLYISNAVVRGGGGATENAPAKSHSELRPSPKPCWHDLVDDTISGTFIWNNWSSLCSIATNIFRFLLDTTTKKEAIFHSLNIFSQFFDPFPHQYKEPPRQKRTGVEFQTKAASLSITFYRVLLKTLIL